VFSRIFNIAEIAKLTTEELMAYNASIQAKWDWDNAVAYAVDAAVEKALEEERAKTEAEKLATARSIKELGILTNQQIAEKFNLPLNVVERL